MQNHILSQFLMTLSLGVLLSITAQAVPAYPGLITTTQPDGTVIEIKLYGDENFSWATTTDGYTMLRNSEDYWVYAQQAPNGWLIPSDIVFRNNTDISRNINIAKGLVFPGEQLSSLKKQHRAASAVINPDLQVDGTFPSTGKNKLLLLLLNYSDTEPIYSKEDFENLMNQENYASIGSFRDFYLENSYGQLDITTTVTRWVTLPYDKKHYGSDRAIEMIQDALYILDDELNLADFDNDGDGILDGLAVIHQGAGQEYTGLPNDIWSHSSIVYGMAFDGIQVRRYTIEPELLGNSGNMSSIGVICHEFGHNLGAPDFYDSDYEGTNGYYSGTGIWDLMSSGAWNGNSGDRPAGINMWQKIQLGWVTPTLLQSTQKVTDMKAAHNNPVAYRFDTTVPGEYFILENRQQSGVFDSALPGHGLLIYHVSEAMIKSTIESNTLNVTHPQAMYLVCASADSDPSDIVSSYGAVNEAGAAFPGTSHNTSFNDASLPSAHAMSGRYSYKGISNISESSEGLINFEFTAEKAPDKPINLTASTNKGIVTLSWDIEADLDAIDHFNIYRNNAKIATCTTTTYTDNDLDKESYITYNVDAVYKNGMISPYSTVSIRIPANFVTQLYPVVNDHDIELTWDINTNLTRMKAIDASHSTTDYNTTTLDYVHRFRADDLKAFKGYKIRKISYLPYQPQSEITLTLRVWEADVDGSNPKIISERLVKEFGTALWNTTLLTKAVEITGEKELWIGIHCESKSGSIRIISDQGPVVESYGNWIKIEDGEWKADKTVPGNFFLYAPLSAPTDEEVSIINNHEEINDPYLDLFFPIGYAIYRDNELLAYTDSRRYIDTAPLSGLHTYSVASLYKGSNESTTLEAEVIYGNEAVSRIETNNARIIVENRSIVLPQYNGQLVITDLMGRTIYNDLYTAYENIFMTPGIYIIKASQCIEKIIIR